MSKHLGTVGKKNYLLTGSQARRVAASAMTGLGVSEGKQDTRHNNGVFFDGN